VTGDNRVETCSSPARVREIPGRQLGISVDRETRGKIEPGRSATGCTAYNDPVRDYLVRRLVWQQRELIEAIARSVAWLGGDPDAT
jgi:hypothetical protein